MEQIYTPTDSTYDTNFAASRAAVGILPPPPGGSVQTDAGKPEAPAGPDVLPQNQGEFAGPNPITEVEEEPEDRQAEEITPAILRRIAPDRFRFVLTADDGTVLFAGPLPPPYGDGLYYELDGDGSIHIPGEDFYFWEVAWELFIHDLQTGCLQPPDGFLDEPSGHKLRTKRQAEQAGAIMAMPRMLAIPTLPSFQNAMMPVQNPTAYLQPITQALASGLEYKDGVLFFQGQPAIGFNLTQFYDYDRKAVSGLDLPTLWALYTVVLKEIEPIARDPVKAAALAQDRQYLSHHFSLYVPKFLEAMGYTPRGCGREDASFMINKINSYERILGIIKEWNGYQEYNSPYPVVKFMGYDEKTNIVHFSCPYLNILVQRIIKASVKTDAKDTPRLKRSGKPQMKPGHSYLIRYDIPKERNTRAVIIVNIIVTLIEQAGSECKKPMGPNGEEFIVPNISARTIIERCPDLAEALDAARTSSDRNKILKRAFSKAWELLRTHTYLTKAYKDIVLPDTIPTAANLDMVFEFPHKGKIRGKITGIEDVRPKKKRSSPKPKPGC